MNCCSTLCSFFYENIWQPCIGMRLETRGYGTIDLRHKICDLVTKSTWPQVITMVVVYF